MTGCCRELYRTGEIYNVLRAQRGFLKTQGLLLGSPAMDLFKKLLEKDPEIGCQPDSLTAEEQTTANTMKQNGVLSVTEFKVTFWSPLHHMYYR